MIRLKAEQSGPWVTVFPSSLGWMAVAGSGSALQRLVFGHSSAESALKSLNRKRSALSSSNDGPIGRAERGRAKSLLRRLQDYAEGAPDDFCDLQLELGPVTGFRQRVLLACRQIPYGTTLTYGQLAAKVGVPRAARAVGSCMAANCIPLVIPCHRVVPAGGRLGNYSAPGGPGMKQRLLNLEAGLSIGKSRKLR